MEVVAETHNLPSLSGKLSISINGIDASADKAWQHGYVLAYYYGSLNSLFGPMHDHEGQQHIVAGVVLYNVEMVLCFLNSRELK
jgi:hypothetical protein